MAYHRSARAHDNCLEGMPMCLLTFYHALKGWLSRCAHGKPDG